jgi:antibiotic biosynthesis monooxygenase (ABM) superfamily enzyme
VERPIYRVVSLWVRSGAVAEFEAYERKAARIMRKYGGSIEKVIRTGQENSPEIPFEYTLSASPIRKSLLPIALISNSCR